MKRKLLVRLVDKCIGNFAGKQLTEMVAKLIVAAAERDIVVILLAVSIGKEVMLVDDLEKGSWDMMADCRREFSNDVVESVNLFVGCEFNFELSAFSNSLATVSVALFLGDDSSTGRPDFRVAKVFASENRGSFIA